MDDTNMENVTAEGTTDANQIVQQPGTPLPSAIDAAKVVEALKPLIDDQIAKALQSTKDKRFAKLEGTMSEFQNQLAKFKELQADGWNEAQAMRLMQLENQLESKPENEPSPKLTGTQKKETAIDEQAILESMGLSANDPEIVSIFATTEDMATRILKSAELAVQRTQKPNPASIVQTAGGSLPARDNPDELAKELATLNPVLNKERYQEVKERLKKLVPKQ
jgi:hypothetical protein